MFDMQAGYWREGRKSTIRVGAVDKQARFGGPQGVIAAERIMEGIGYRLGRDSRDVCKAKVCGAEGRDLTPYHQRVEDIIAPRIFAGLKESADYRDRREAVLERNDGGGVIRKGIALTPVKFGISFTPTCYNQAEALLHVNGDGSIHLNHGGTEMNQGLSIKDAQVVADALQVDVERIKITRTTTEKVPNTSATTASSGTDLNGMAARDAAEQIKARLTEFVAERRQTEFAVERWQTDPSKVRFEAHSVFVGAESIAFFEFVREACLARVHLSAAGFYKTPRIHRDRGTGMGRPFYDYGYGAACPEGSVDTQTGEYRVERTNILHDVGLSPTPALDRGQVEGAFVHSMGWLTIEELWRDDRGQLRTHALSTYGIQLASDRPRVFDVTLADRSRNHDRTIKRAKAVDEPPFMPEVSVFEALSMVVASVADDRTGPRPDAPATPGRVPIAVERLRRER